MEAQKIDEFENRGKRTFKPEKDGRGNDTVHVPDSINQVF